MDGLEAEFGADVTFERLNAAEAEVLQLQQTFGLRGHPSVAILDVNGAVVQRYFGPETAEKLREDLTAVLR